MDLFSIQCFGYSDGDGVVDHWWGGGGGRSRSQAELLVVGGGWHVRRARGYSLITKLSCKESHKL